MAEQAAILVPRKRRSQIGDLVIDVTLEEAHSLSAEITDRPIEEGADISDGVRQKPDAVTLQVIWSDVPGGDELAEAGRARRLWNKLRELKEAGEPVDVLTSLRSYTNVVISNVETRKSRRTGFTVPASITIREVNIAAQETVEVPPEAIDPDSQAGAGDEDNEGRRTTEEGEDGRASFLHGLLF